MKRNYMNQLITNLTIIDVSFIALQVKEQEKLDRIQTTSQKSDVQNALDNFMQIQKSKDEEVKSKEDIVADNKEKKLRELQEKMRAKKEHAEMVRRRKKLAALELNESGDTGETGETGLSVDASIEC